MTTNLPFLAIHIWPVCPELQPDGLNIVSNENLPCRWHLPHVFIEDAVAAALIRDRAVWWLADRYNKRGVAIVQNESMTAVCMLPDTGIDSRSLHEDPTEALRLAVCKVLGIDPVTGGKV